MSFTRLYINGTDTLQTCEVVCMFLCSVKSTKPESMKKWRIRQGWMLSRICSVEIGSHQSYNTALLQGTVRMGDQQWESHVLANVNEPCGLRLTMWVTGQRATSWSTKQNYSLQLQLHFWDLTTRTTDYTGPQHKWWDRFWKSPRCSHNH